MKITELKHKRELGEWLNRNGLLGKGVEVGVAYGENAKCILETWKGKTLYLIDPWCNWKPGEYVDGSSGLDWEGTFRYAMALLAPFQHRIHVVRAASPESTVHFQDNSLDFVYIDANHHLPRIKQDVEQWWEKVKPGGLLGGHDYMNINAPDYRCEVKSTVDEFVSRRNLSLHTTTMDTLDYSWWIHKI